MINSSKLTILSFFWGLLWTGLLFSQGKAIQFDHLSVDQGLSQSSVMAILQDSKGFMWFGTQDGLNKYDGVHFKTYRNKSDSAATFRSNFIQQIYEDRYGKFWLATEGTGLQKFDPDKEIFETHRLDREPGGPRDYYVRRFDEDSEGNLWHATSEGLVRYDRDLNSFFPYPIKGITEEESEITTLLIDSQDVFWVGTSRQGLYIFDQNEKTYKRAGTGLTSEQVATNIFALYEDNSRNLWISFWPFGLLQYVRGTGQFISHGQPMQENTKTEKNFIVAITEDLAGNIWLATASSGLAIVDPSANTATRLYHDPFEPKSLSNNHVQSIYSDRAGTIWVGTSGGGINKYDPRKTKFVHYKSSFKNPEALEGGLVWSLFEDSRGLLWIGTMSGGLNMLDRQTGQFEIFKHDPTDSRSIASNHVNSVAEDSKGNLWIGTGGGGLNKFDPQTNTFRHFRGTPKNNEGLLTNSVRQVVIDTQQRIWLATRGGGFYAFNPETEVFTPYLHDPNDPKSLSSNLITCVIEDKNRMLWVGTVSGGINRFNPETESFTRFCGECGTKGLSSNYVMAIGIDGGGNIWIGTFDGLNKLEPETGVFTHYTTEHGLPNDVVYGVLADDHDKIWVSTNRGLSRFDPETETFKNFVLEDGLQSYEFNSGAYFKNSKGEMFFGGVNGFNVFHPDSVKDNPIPPPVVITALKKFDQEIDLPDNLNLPVHLSYQNNFIQFEFAALDYANPARNQYAYKLEGLHEDWINCGTQRYATFTNLHPGRYVFRVKAANNDGIWNEKGASLKLVVTPPFWRSWWFRWLTAVLVISALLIFIRILKQRERKEAELNKKFSELKLKALRAQMNPHFVFNTINSIQYYISSNAQKLAYQYLSKFAKLMRMVLENSEKSTQTIAEELEALKLYLELEALRFEGKFDYSIEVSPDIDIHNNEIPALLIQPFVENAIQHGLRFKRTKGSLRIKLTQEDESLNCLIEDNGIGIEKSLELKSKQNGSHRPAGLKVSQERLETLNAMRRNGRGIEILDLSKTTNGEQGTRVKIVIPLESIQV